MTTNTSQGGNLAIEDGYVLARTLGNGASPQDALRAYEERRIARTTPLVNNSRWISNMNAWHDPLRVAFRDRFFSVGVPRKGLSDLRKAMAVTP
jgi:2-polyprenyl-6-methoxyphenol hydroxylase-like FAD-dependent oxidoreductase